MLKQEVTLGCQCWHRYAMRGVVGWGVWAWLTRGVASLNPLLQAGMAPPSGRGLQGGALPPSYGLMAPPSDAGPALMGADVPAAGLTRFLILSCHVEVW